MEICMIIWQIMSEGWLRLATEQASLNPACRWERKGLNKCKLVAEGWLGENGLERMGLNRG